MSFHIHWYKEIHRKLVPFSDLIYIDRRCRCGKFKGKYL